MVEESVVQKISMWTRWLHPLISQSAIKKEIIGLQQERMRSCSFVGAVDFESAERDESLLAAAHCPRLQLPACLSAAATSRLWPPVTGKSSAATPPVLRGLVEAGIGRLLQLTKETGECWIQCWSLMIVRILANFNILVQVNIGYALKSTFHFVVSILSGRK
jgi:hypothetical protein